MMWLSSRVTPLLLGACLAAQAATTNSWIATGNSTWNTASNWDPAEVPNGVGSMAIITNTSLGVATLITSDINVILGALEISGASSFHFTITNDPGVTWRMENNGQGVSITGNGPGSNTTGDRLWVPIEIAEDLTVYTASKAVTFSGPITESGGSRQIIKTGSGYLVLGSEASTFTGGIHVRAGNLNAATTGSTTSKIGTGVITLGDTTGVSSSGVIGNGNYTNSIIVASGSSGTKIIRNSGGGGILNVYGPITLNDNLDINASSSTRYTRARGDISGLGGIVATSQAGREATNYVYLTGSNTFSGGVTLKTGNLRVIGHEIYGYVGATALNLTYSLGTGTLTIENGTILSGDGNSNRVITNSIVVNGNFKFGCDAARGTLRLLGPMDLGSEIRTLTMNSTVGHYIEGPISGAGGIIKKGAQGLNLYGANSFNGGFTISEGSVTYYGDSAFGTGLLTMGEAASTSNMSITGDGTVTNDIAVVAGVSGGRTLGCTNDATATYSGNITLGTDLILGGASSSPRSVVVSGPISGTGSLFVNGSALTTVTLSGANSYDGTTTVGGGTLYIANTTGSATSFGAVTVTNGILAGTGLLDGSTTIEAGGTLAPGNNGLGLLTINNALVLAAGSTNVMELNKALGTNDVVLANSITYGGTLVAINIAGDLAVGDSFKLFSTPTPSGAFSEVIVPGATAQFEPVSGLLTITGTMATYPTNILTSFNSSTSELTLSWPETHKGWLAQSNSVDVADTASWFPIPGSDAGTNLIITVDPATPKVFYRLVRP